MTTTRVILSLVACFLCASVLVAQVDVTGKWNMTVSTPRGERTNVLEFTQEGEALTVISEGREGQKVEAKGTVTGNDIQWTINRETERGKFELTYKGQIEGDSMKGTVQFGSRGSGEWSAERAE